MQVDDESMRGIVLIEQVSSISTVIEMSRDTVPQQPHGPYNRRLDLYCHGDEQRHSSAAAARAAQSQT
jgi:hypothetical protein